jgi:hypothetical protein
MVANRFLAEFLQEPSDRALAKLRGRAAAMDSKALERAVGDALSWSAVLPARDRVLLVDDLFDALELASDTEEAGLVVQLLREWEATAAIHADPVLARRLSTAIDVCPGTE